VKNVVIAALSAGLLGVLPAAQAASVSIDAGNYVLSYEDTFLTGATVSTSGGDVTFSNLSYNTYALGGILETNGVVGSFDSYAGKPFPIVITPKAGVTITGLTETVAGEHRASAADSQGSQAGVVAGLVSRWVVVNGADMLGQNTPYTIVSLTAGQSSLGAHSASGSLSFAASQPIGLSALDLLLGAGAVGQGSAAYASLQQYKIGIQTAAVPEPEVMALVLAGLGVVAYQRRRQQKKA
jgi:hypothetical protein